MATRAIDRVANDNSNDHSASEGSPCAMRGDNGQLMQAALRHFAKHGMGAARQARAQAEQAFFADDRQAYDWWIGITRTLDRRLAEEAERAAI